MGKRMTDNRSIKIDDASTIVERIVCAIEQRGEDRDPSIGPLTNVEINKLSMLCAELSEKRINPISIGDNGSCNVNVNVNVNENSGFANVDVDMMAELVEYLEKHVALASGIDFIQSAFDAIQILRSNDGNNEADYCNIDEWIMKGRGSVLLTTLSNGLEAARTILYIMTSYGIDRRVVKEDAIVASIVLMRHNIAKNILPAINDCGHITTGMSKSQLQFSPVPTKKRRRRSSVGDGSSDSDTTLRDMKKCYKSVFKLIGYTVLLMERIDTLIQRTPLDDQHIMTCSAGALVSLELDPSTDAAVQLSHQLHVATISLVTSIFRMYSKLRTLIVEDLFALMLKMPSGKRGMRTFPIQSSNVMNPQKACEFSKSLWMGATGSSSPPSSNIQPISIIVMNLVQSSVIRPSFESMEHDNSEDANNQVNTQPRLISGLRACQAVSDFFVNHLLRRCSRKGEDGGASEFRPILNNLIEDLLLVLLVPEFPAAEMIVLSIANCMYHDIIQMTTSKRGKESITTTYFNTIFDALGKISAAVARINKWNEENCARLDLPIIRKNKNTKNSIQHLNCYCNETEFGDKFMLKCDRCKAWFHGECIGVSQDDVPEKWLCDGCQFNTIVEFEVNRNTNLGELSCSSNLIDRPYCLRRLVIDYLSVMSLNSEVMGIRDAYGFQLARWLNQLDSAIASNKCNVESRGNMSLIPGLIRLWDPQASLDLNDDYISSHRSLSGMFNCLSDEGRSRMIVDFTCKLSTLLISFRSQVGRIVKLLESPSKSVRKLSLKAIEKIADADPKLMTIPFVRNAVTRRFSDESISVRDAVVSLVGSYVVNTPDVANAFHPALIHSLSDFGVSVRKRTVLVLLDILLTNSKYEGRAEACSMMLRLAADPKEDDTVRDLIYDLFSKIWLDTADKTADGDRRISHSSRNLDDTSPLSKVSNLDIVGLTDTPLGSNTPMTDSDLISHLPNTPHTNTLTLPTKTTRSTTKKVTTRYLQIRCETAVHQMVEVVKTANTEHDLTILFRELLSDTPDSDKTKKSSARKKRNGLAKNQIAMLVDCLFEKLLAVEEDNEKSTTEKGGDLISIFRTLKVFTDVSPLDVLRHLDTLLPYLKIDNGLRPIDEAEIACSLCQILSRVVPELDQDDCERLAGTSLADDLVVITKRWGKAASSSAVQTLCLFADKEVSNHLGVFGGRLLSIAKMFYSYLVKTEKLKEFATKRKTKDHVNRALSVLGSISRFYASSSFDSLEIEDVYGDNGSKLVEVTLPRIAPQCEHIFMKYYSKDDVMTKVAAIQALSGVFMAHPREMLKLENNGVITEVMAPSSPELVQRESLRCWRDILLAEESRVESGEAKARMDAKKDITVSKKISGDQDGDATLFGAILTNHASRLFEMTKSREKDIRFAAVDLLGHLLRQGQLNPNEATPHLLALQGDVEESIRGKALKYLMLEGEKRPDMLRQRLCAGVKHAYLFQVAVYPELEDVSALITIKKDGGLQKECVFGSVYKECISKIKKQRRGLLRHLLNEFDTQSLKKEDLKKNDLHKNELMLLSYTSQVIAYLPYNFSSDVLYIIYYISSNIALQGADLLDKFDAFLRPYGLASVDELDESNTEEDDLEVAVKDHYPYPARNLAVLSKKSFDQLEFSHLCSEAGCLVLLLRLKCFLKETYNLSESRCTGYNPDAKTVGEKPVQRSSTSSVFDSKLPIHSWNKNKTQNKQDLQDGMIIIYAEFRRRMREEITQSPLEDKSDTEFEMVLEEVSNKRRSEST